MKLILILYCANSVSDSCFRVIAGKTFNQSDYRVLCSYIFPDGMTESHGLFACRQILRGGNKFKIVSYLIVCGAQRLHKRCSVTEKSA